MPTQPEQALRTQFISYTKSALHASLVDEVSATPKPGLVDLHDSGAHTDMDFHTFLDSADAIAPFLASMAELGTEWRLTGRALSPHTKEESLFLAIRPIGLEAEAAMFAATKGVNTHKGMIFSMGTIAAAAGYRFADLFLCTDGAATAAGDGGVSSRILLGEDILNLCMNMCRRPVADDFSAISSAAPKTHGERLYVQYGIRGIRGEAADGFPAVRTCALPFLRKELAESGITASSIALITSVASIAPTVSTGTAASEDWNRICLLTLLRLMANVDDTNILYRTDYRSLLYVRERAKEILAAHPLLDGAGIEALRELNRDFIGRNLSPGGCADLLAITLFLWRLEQFSPDRTQMPDHHSF